MEGRRQGDGGQEAGRMGRGKCSDRLHPLLELLQQISHQDICSIRTAVDEKINSGGGRWGRQGLLAGHHWCASEQTGQAWRESSPGACVAGQGEGLAATGSREGVNQKAPPPQKSEQSFLLPGVCCSRVRVSEAAALK